MSVLLIILVLAHTLFEGFVGGKPIKTERLLLDDDKMREYLVWFRFFDNDKDAQLQHKQFKEILWVLGRIPHFDEQPEFERILSVVDPKRNGFITRQAFMAYLVTSIWDAALTKRSSKCTNNTLTSCCDTWNCTAMAYSTLRPIVLQRLRPKQKPPQ